MTTIHISQAEVERDLAGLLARLNEDTTFVIDNGTDSVAVINAAPPRRPSLHERIALLPKDEEAVMDADFARDVQAGIDPHRASIDSSLWDE